MSNFPMEGSRQLLTTPERVRADARFRGRGVVMAFVDSGYAMHPDIKGRIVLHVDASSDQIIEQPAVGSVSYLSWHGQMTSVVAAGNGTLSNGKYRGIASESQLVLIKVSTPEGAVREMDILRGLEWLCQNHRRFGIRVVNMSVGGDDVDHNPRHPLHVAVAELVHAGVVVVIAAGNVAEKWLLPPATAPQALVIGGYDDRNHLDRQWWQPYHSNYGQAYDRSAKPDLIAPAQWIASPILEKTDVSKEARWLGMLLNDSDGRALKNLLAYGYHDLALDRGAAQAPDEGLLWQLQTRIHNHKLIHPFYQHVDGTSVAAPIVSSIVAQMLEANPALTPPQVKAILRRTARHVKSIPHPRQGMGAVEPQSAINVALRLRDLPVAKFHFPFLGKRRAASHDDKSSGGL